MTQPHATAAEPAASAARGRRGAARSSSGSGSRGQWWRFALITVITVIALVPIAAVLYESLKPGLGSKVTSAFTFENFTSVFPRPMCSPGCATASRSPP
jgi:hypothetical protein